MEAPDRDAAIRQLRGNHYLPVMVRSADDPAEHPATLFTNGQEAPALPRLRASRHRRGLSLALLTREIQMLIASGLSPDKALDVIASTSKSTAAATVASDLRAAIRQGLSLSQSMAAHPQIFDPLYLSIVAAGERAGTLDDALEQLAAYLDEIQALKDSIRSALRYPAFLAVATLASLAAMLAFVVPQFERLLRESASELPVLARAVFDLSDILRSHGWMLVTAFVLVWLVLRVGIVGQAARRRWDDNVLRLPVIGTMVVELDIERYARAFSILLESGLGLTEAMENAAPVCRNRKVRATVNDAVARVRRGDTLAVALGADRVLPPFAVELIHIGEESGRLAPLLRRVADRYATQRRSALDRLVGVIGPIAILSIGLVVGVMVTALYSVMLSLNVLVD